MFFSFLSSTMPSTSSVLKGLFVVGPTRRDIYHMTHMYNVPSIMRDGILSHNVVHTKSPHSIYNADVVDRGSTITLPSGKTLWDYANFYFQPRNPMLYQVTRNVPADSMAILVIRPDVLPLASTYVSSGSSVNVGNAAHSITKFLSVEDAARTPWFLSQLKSVLDLDWWSELDGSKRKIMMECLVPNRVPASAIHGWGLTLLSKIKLKFNQTKYIYDIKHENFLDSLSDVLIYGVFVSSATAVETLKSMKVLENRPIIVNPNMFFEPQLQISLTSNVSIVRGDMFFSKMQVLSISVNTVGVMGKGLASACKFRFPDAYVNYQSLCSTNALKMGNPKLYKREASLDTQLANNPYFSLNANSVKWFLFFPTKTHWKQDSDLEGIRQGMKWLVNNYKKEGIKSIALPALGCGLGNLCWRDVGPIMCRALAQMDIKVEVYLPAEMSVPSEELTKEFLLS